jgi:membrane protein involved in colicin uptake
MFSFNLKDTKRISIDGFNSVFIKPSQKRVIDEQERIRKEIAATQEETNREVERLRQIERENIAKLIAREEAAKKAAREEAAKKAAEEEAAKKAAEEEAAKKAAEEEVASSEGVN